MSKAIARTYNLASEYRSYITVTLMAGCIMAALFYGVNVYKLIARTVALQNVEHQTADLDVAVSNLESAYMNLSSTLTPDSVKTFGMTTGQVSVFIPRTSTLGRVAADGHEF